MKKRKILTRGIVDGAYMLFADEEDYQEYFREWH